MASDEQAFEIIPGPATSPLIFCCDHASNALPAAYGDLGLEPAQFQRHIAYDIGAAAMTRTLAALFDAPAVLGRWTRLLVDLNRGPDDPTIVMRLSDGALIPGNARADDAEFQRRIARFHAPYHAALGGAVDAALAAGVAPTLVSMHSFTPAWKNVPRGMSVAMDGLPRASSR